MRKLLSIFFFACMFMQVLGQFPERKIIIQDGKFYYTTIHEEFQVATLHTGNITDPLKVSKDLALPAGRNYNEPINPFSWDIDEGYLYGISFLDHPLNDRNEAIKKIPFSSLQEWNEYITPMAMIMESAERNMYISNDPWIFVSRRSSILDNFFFDGILAGKFGWMMAIANRGELSIWFNDGSAWKHSEVINFPLTGYFTLFCDDKDIYLMMNSGAVYSVDMESSGDLNGLTKVPAPSNISLNDGFLVINHDDGSTKYLQNIHTEHDIPFKEVIENYAISLF